MRALALAVAAGFGLLAAPVEAQPEEAEVEQARAAFERAVEAYDQGAYEEAEAGFRRSHALTGHPELLYNIYLSAERSGRHAEAAVALGAYLEQGEVEPDRRRALEARVLRLRARAEAPALGGEVGQLPAVDPEDEGDREISTPVIFVEKARIPLASTLLFIAAGALAVSFGVAAGLSEAEDRDLANTCGRDTDFPSCPDDSLDALRRRNLVADISWIGALTAAAAGLLVLFAAGADDEPPRVSASLGPGSLSLRGSF